MKVTSRTHVGNVRKINEDSLYTGSNKLDHTIMVIADGMGGHNAGEVASAIARSVVEREFLKAKYSDIKKFLAEVIKLSNEEIYTSSLTNEDYAKMGTTLSICIIVDDIIYIGHVGDSRIYFFNEKGEKSYQLTTDHTVVQMLHEQGHLTKEEVDNHPYRNILAQSVGTSPKISADIVELKLPRSGYILACSDGLSDELTIDEMGTIVQLSLGLEQKADILLQSVLKKKAKDNISLILVER